MERLVKRVATTGHLVYKGPKSFGIIQLHGTKNFENLVKSMNKLRIQISALFWTFSSS